MLLYECFTPKVRTYVYMCVYNYYYYHHIAFKKIYVLMLMMKLLLATLLFHVTHSTVHHVIPDDEYSQCNSTAKLSTLQYYLNNSRRYFNSHTELWFDQGQHYLCKDLLLQNVNNFTINGNNSTLSCIRSELGIAIANVTSITIINLHIKQCSKVCNIQQQHKSEYVLLINKAVILINNSADVVITNVSITINNSNISGIIGVNVATSTKMVSASFANITVLAWCDKCNHTSNSVSGITLSYNDDVSGYKPKAIIQQFIYKTHGLCSNSYALRLSTMQRRYNVKIYRG